MIYIADGPNDIPAFSLINRMGGHTFAVYKKNDIKSFQQAELLREDGRVNMYAEASYTQDYLAYLCMYYKIKKIADRIVNAGKENL